MTVLQPNKLYDSFKAHSKPLRSLKKIIKLLVKNLSSLTSVTLNIRDDFNLRGC